MKELTEQEKEQFEITLYKLTQAIDQIGQLTETLIKITIKDVGSDYSRGSSDSRSNHKQPAEQKTTKRSK